MQTVSCPSCGAEVHFRSHASVMAVCEYCKSTVLKDADAVKDLGKMSSVLEDYSPIQIGTAGTHGGKKFTVIGRIQLRYAAGMWNEWYVLFDDGSASWLGDSSGLYTMTTQRKVGDALPQWSELAPGQSCTVANERYTVAEVRNAECVAGQGELPFRVGAGYRIQVADLRNRAAFVTLDYSDGAVPVVFTGTAVTLGALKCQLLRDDEEIKRGAGKYRGKLDTLDCPSCGGAIAYLPGVTPHLICPACQTQIDAAGPQAQVLAAGARVEAIPTSLTLGARAKVNGQDFQVSGYMRRADEEGSAWTEYLLFNSRAGFFWLVETESGWFRANVMPEWPIWRAADTATVTLDNVSYAKRYEYNSTVLAAAGAFNWRVSAGDATRVYEFFKGKTQLAAEVGGGEMTWSRSTPVAYDQMKTWFGSQFGGAGEAPALPAETAKAGKYGGVASTFIWIIITLNIVPLFVNFFSTAGFSLLAILAIYLPATFLDSNTDE
ncbi:DUF4178 domain-containing protein [Janthinobacterium fluminis]|uniref:DUF4178 domain-containing protein n=1 Tax=Janthinobacterium fluminis TaxID=2987524 RepID=A0ABT5JYH9_9BURK|nr:DUF4178 domain-containing protein [Janthinobacterium fluminis]MDC8757794.1 DUF4178 domain-containing protein [Janthinobacterium fluminis]